MTTGTRRIVLVQAGLAAGGTEKIICLLATHLDRLGHAVTVLAISGHGSESFYPMPAGVTLRTMEEELSSAASRSTISRIGWLRRAVRESEADLVMSFLTKINVQTAIACTGLGVRRIASERNNFQVQAMNPLWRRLMPVALATADRSVLLTEASRAALPRWARRRSAVIYNPVPAQLEPATTAPPPRRLIAVGRLTEQKGFDVLIRAIHRARERGCAMELTIHGEGEDRESLSGLAQSLGISDLVRLPGRTRRPHEWTEGGGIFVLSSRYEGFANVLLEAMAAGFAVVSTACDWGPPEILTHGRDGLLVPVEDHEHLAEALIRLWTDEALRARLAGAARRRAADFSEAHILSDWDRVIAEALHGGRRPSIALAPAPVQADRR